MQLLRFYIRPGPPESLEDPLGVPQEGAGGSGGVPLGGAALLGSPLKVARRVEPKVTSVTSETCYYLAWEGANPPDPEQSRILQWVLGSPLGGAQQLAPESFLRAQEGQILLEIGPRLGLCTASSTNAVSLCHAAGLPQVRRLERSRRLLLQFEGHPPEGALGRLGRALRDPMTEELYPEPLSTFSVPSCPTPVTTVDVLAGGSQALEEADKELGLAFDRWDLQYYTNLFRSAGRNPTSVECFDLAQSNSEHSRHWFFKGRLVVDGREEPESLFQMLMDTQKSSNPNNVIKFCDNSSAIRGVAVTNLWPQDPAGPSPYQKQTSIRHVTFTAETHNFPTAVAPFSGATTGTGGRIRDVQSTGRGAHVIAGTAGYSFGNLLIPGYELPWEDPCLPYPGSFARPLEVAIGASDGASDYGNKFGEPLLAGFARSFGQVGAGGQRREWIKPIMFSGGLGAIEDLHIRKETPEPGMLVVKVGGPVYRIGVGGGAASSIQVQGDNAEERDLGAVQRGDPEMEQKMNRVLRGCIEAGGGQLNPICSIHDQGAGGNGNVLKELSEPAGAVIYASRFQLGDPTLSLLELWGAEYQESNALLVRGPGLGLLRRLAARERCPLDVVGRVSGQGRIVLVDDLKSPVPEGGSHEGLPTPVDLQLEWVLGKMPRKEFLLQKVSPVLRPLELPQDLQVLQALDRVLRLPAVASKRYLTNKVDRSVTGLVAQQQCVGALHTPLADVAVVALSHWDTLGAATSLGEQPIKGLLDPAAGARLALAEALTNLAFARITQLRDVKCSGNWMWAAKGGAEGGALLEACKALVELMKALGVAIDGGKDSLSMAARVGTQTVLAPGTIVVSAYAVCPDITATVTPDLKCPQGRGALLWVHLSPGKHRLGGTALAQVFSQLGDSCPDLESPQALAAAFGVTQELLKEGLLASGHDVSDGGLLGCLLEMAFAGNCGLRLDLPLPPPDTSPLALLFSEEPGLLLEVPQAAAEATCRRFQQLGVSCVPVGHSGPQGPRALVQVSVGGREVLVAPVGDLRAIWEATSFQLERQQAAPGCVAQEEAELRSRQGPAFRLTFDYLRDPPLLRHLEVPGPRVAVLREEGSNGDREMASAFSMAGCQVWDLTTEDLCSGSATLDGFRGLVFVGGFSYGDVLGSAKGWAAAVRFHPKVGALLERFRRRPDTFSLGVCNGCQLMALLGWVGPQPPEPGGPPAVVLSPNLSGRFESRFVAVRVEPGPALMLRGMEGSCLGVWVAHGEGRFQFQDPALLGAALEGSLVPLRYVDDGGAPTTSYPLNPNGSAGGVAALCSPCGRHLALMPHPERGVLSWQWPWWPPAWPKPQAASQEGLKVAPWLRMFQNAAEWCLRWPQGQC